VFEEPGPPAGITMPAGCLPRTRTDVFQVIETWLKHPDEDHNILYISGSPGTGKSAIASSLVHIYSRYSVFFFFRRDSEYFRNPASVGRNLASQLSKLQDFPILQQYLLNHIKANPSYLEKVYPLDHIKDLVLEALKQVKEEDYDQLPLVILDALDECQEMDSQGENKRIDLLKVLVEWKKLPKKCKLIVTGRSQKDIEEVLRASSKLISLPSGDIVDDTMPVYADIKLFLESEFDKIDTMRLDHISKNAIVEQLTKQAAGLFIWAKTLVDFVGGYHGSAFDRLQEVLSKLGKHEFQDISDNKMDKLYSQILQSVFSGLTQKEKLVYSTVLGMLVCAEDPISVYDLEELLTMVESGLFTSSYIKSAITAFKCVLITDGPGYLLRFCHKSFIDFVESHPEYLVIHSKRLNLQGMTIAQLKSEWSAIACLGTLRYMNSHLHFNMAKQMSSHIWNNDDSYLAEKVDKSVNSTLKYSSRWWGKHLGDASGDGRISLSFVQDAERLILGEAENFFENNLLSWLEVISLKNLVSVTPTLLVIASQAFQVRNIYFVG